MTFENTNEITKKEEEMGSIFDADMLANILEGPENIISEGRATGIFRTQLDNHKDEGEGFVLGEIFGN